MQFLVSGVTSGNVVEILADGNVIGQATPTGTDTTVTVTTDASTILTDGTHNFTAIQIAKNQTVPVTENGSSTPLSKTADVPSLNSPAAQLVIDTVPPEINFPVALTAVVAVPYKCQVAVTEGTATYQLISPPAGMAIDANTGVITWTPTSSQVGTAAVTIQATDAAGNSAQKQYSINVLADNNAPVLAAAKPSLGTTISNTAKTNPLAKFINGALSG